MKKSIFAVCDLESSYACSLMEYMNERRTTPFEVQAFTNIESLISFAKENPIEILLISTNAMCNEIKRLDIRRIVILSEGESLPDLEEYPSVYKYQASDSLISEVMNYYAVQKQVIPVPAALSRTELYGVYSPVSRCGKTSFALTLGEILGEKKQVLYLNLEEYAGFEELFQTVYDRDITDLLYFSRQRRDAMLFKLSGLIRQFHHLDYVPPALSPMDLRTITGEEWLVFFGSLAEQSGYDILILDIGGHLDDMYRIFRQCRKIYMPILEDEVSLAKAAQFEHMLQLMDCGDIQEKLKRLKLPLVKGPAGGTTDQLVFGEMGNYVRKLLWEEEENRNG